MSLDLTSFDSVLKQYYTSDRVQNMVYKNQPFFASVSKDEKFGGRNKPINLIYGNPQGVSTNFATAQANATSTQVDAFLLTRKPLHGVATIDNETIEASQGDKYAFMEASKTEIDGIIHSVGRQIAVAMFRSSGMTIGQLDSSVTLGSTTALLRETSDITNIEKGMKIQLASAEAGGSLRDSGATVTVNAVNRSAGSFTVSANLSTITGATVNDFIVVEGNYDNGISGLASWLPATAPTSGDNFFGIDRSVDVTRLAGSRYDGSSDDLEDALVEGASIACREGGDPDIVFLSFAKYSALVKELGAKVQYIQHKKGEISFSGVALHSPKGELKVIPDVNCPSNRAYILEMKTWKLCSLGKAPKLFDTDGQKMLRQAANDGVEVRVNFYGNLSCNAPGYNAVVLL